MNEIDKSKSTSSNITIPVPDGLTYFPFQKAGIEYALKRNSTLIADEMGFYGKTIQAIGFINAKDDVERVLIVWVFVVYLWFVGGFGWEMVERVVLNLKNKLRQI